MMYMHYCKKCHRIMMLTGHKMICPRCTDPLTELRISYLDYVDLGPGEREALLQKCANESELSGLKTTYRMYKYSKWYRDRPVFICQTDPSFPSRFCLPKKPTKHITSNTQQFLQRSAPFPGLFFW